MGNTALFTEVRNPRDLTYQMQRQKSIDDLLRMNDRELNRMLEFQMQQKAPSQNAGVGKGILTELATADYVPQTVKNILGSTSGGGLNDGSPLIRQDLEPVLYA